MTASHPHTHPPTTEIKILCFCINKLTFAFSETRAATSGLTSEQDYMTITDIGRDARSLSVPALPPRVDPQQDLSLTDKLADRAPMPPPRSKNRGEASGLMVFRICLFAFCRLLLIARTQSRSLGQRRGF